MPDGENANRTGSDPAKEDPIIPNAKPELFAGWAQPFHVARTVSQVIVNGVQYPESNLAINREKLNLRIPAPDDDLLCLHGMLCSARVQIVVPEHFVVSDAFAVAGEIEFGCQFGRYVLVLKRRVGERMGNGIHHDFKQMDNRRQLAAIQLTDQFDRMSFIGGSFHCVHYASTSGVRSPEAGGGCFSILTSPVRLAR